MAIASSPTSPSRTSRSVIRTESPPHPGSNYRVRFLTFPWGKVLTSGGRGAVPDWFWVPPHTRQDRVRVGPLKTKDRPHVCSPRRRKPSPTGKVDRAQPGTDEGNQPKSEKQATLNGSISHSMWPVSLLGYGPSSVTPYGVPPSPWGKATSGGGVSLSSPGGRCRRSGGRGAVPGWFWVPPHTRQGFALPPSPRRGFFPSSVPGCARSTFPEGKGFLRRGRSLTFPLAFQTFFPFTPFTNPLLCCKIGSSSQKLWEVWS